LWGTRTSATVSPHTNPFWQTKRNYVPYRTMSRGIQAQVSTENRQ
jgi:hypothetical protein